MNPLKTVFRTGLIALLAVSMVTPGRAQVMTFDFANFAGILQQIASASAQIKRMSEMVGAARDQLDTLQKVSSGIRNLNQVVRGGVQGILGSVSDSLGLKDVFLVGKGIQGLVTDSLQLYRDAKALPDHAKQRYREIGLAIEDVEEYLAHGVMYEAFSGMGVDEWRSVFKDPIDAFANGAVGRAIVRTEAYLDTEDLRRRYAEKLATLTPEERARLTKSAGVDMAVLNFAAWGKGLEKRIAQSLNYSVVADKLLKVAGEQETLGGALAANNAASLTTLKAEADNSRDRATAEVQSVEQLARQTTIMSDKERRAYAKEEAAAIVVPP